MSLQYDAEFLEVLQRSPPPADSATQHAVHDVASRRVMMNEVLPEWMNKFPDAPDVARTKYQLEVDADNKITLHGFSKERADIDQKIDEVPGPAIVHCHGGGMILGTVDHFGRYLAFLVSKTAVPIYSVDYRTAPEYPHPTPVEDCYAGLLWLHKHCRELKIDPTRIAMMGESGGGGIAAGVTLMARDKSLQPPIAKQILICPMLDDKNLTRNEKIARFAVWTTEDNITGWTALLGVEKVGKQDEDISPYAAPARVESVAGLPSTYMDIGELDIFRDECIEYTMRIARENISTEFHLYPGVPHGFEMIAPDIILAKSALENKVRAMTSF